MSDQSEVNTKEQAISLGNKQCDWTTAEVLADTKAKTIKAMKSFASDFNPNPPKIKDNTGWKLMPENKSIIK